MNNLYRWGQSGVAEKITELGKKFLDDMKNYYANRKPILRGCANTEGCFCTGACKEIIGFEDEPFEFKKEESKMINNAHLIRPLLKFDSDDDFYFIQILQRKKDHKGQKLGPNNSSRLIKSYNIRSVEWFDELLPEMIEMAKIFNARVGINLNKRSFKSCSLEMMVTLAQSVKANSFNQNGLWNKVVGQEKGTDKMWILDVDTQDQDFIDSVIKEVEASMPKKPIVTVIPSRQGCHVITQPFDTREFIKKFPDVSIHKNNPTNIIIP